MTTENAFQVAVDLNNLSLSYNLINILQQISINLGLIGAGTDGNILMCNSANLFQLAADNYNDALQWTVIAKANGISDPNPIFPTTVPLIIPAQAGLPTGGVVIP